MLFVAIREVMKKVAAFLAASATGMISNAQCRLMVMTSTQDDDTSASFATYSSRLPQLPAYEDDDISPIDAPKAHAPRCRLMTTRRIALSKRHWQYDRWLRLRLHCRLRRCAFMRYLADVASLPPPREPSGIGCRAGWDRSPPSPS